MPNHNLMAEVADVGRDLLELSSSHIALRKYTWQLGAICDLIKHTHSIVVEKLDEIESAKNLSEATRLVDELEEEPLTNTFRTNGLCDIFEGFGIALRNIVGTTFYPDGTQESLPISDSRKQVWLEFCQALENRESKMASLYAHEIQEIGDLVSGAAEVKDLEKIKDQARKARAVLTSQKADFESLADNFRSKSY